MAKESMGRKVLHALQKLHIVEGDIIVVSDLEVMGALGAYPMPGIPQVPFIFSPDGLGSIGTIDIKTLREVLAAAEKLEQDRLREAADQPLPPKLEVVQ